jgi:ubiquinone/menaquinone biosynthesis C-methylase UbiE
MSSTPLEYAPWRATTLGAITERLERTVVLDLAGPLEGRRVLEVGCGDGAYALAAARAGAHVTGLDRSAAVLDAARARAKAEGLAIDLQVGDAGALPFPADRFDVVLAVTVLCFVENPAQAVAEMARVLRPGGVLGRAMRFGAAFVAIAARQPGGRN